MSRFMNYQTPQKANKQAYQSNKSLSNNLTSAINNNKSHINLIDKIGKI